MRIIFKIILALLIAVNLSFATDNYIDDYYDSLEKKTIPKKFLNKDCRKLVKKIFCESKYTYISDSITNIWKEPILSILIYEPPLKDIEYMKNIKYKSCTMASCYDFDFKWLNNKTLLAQMYRPKNNHNPNAICELWLFEEKDDNIDVYHFISWNLPD